MRDLVQSFESAILALDRVGAGEVFSRAMASMSPIEAVEAIVIPALQNVGDGWEKGTVALSQVYMGGRLCEELVEKVLPPSDPDRKRQPRTAIVVLSDYHMLGKRIVYSVMRASGFELFDYGRMDVDELVDRAIQDRLAVLMISVLLLPSALKVGEVCQRLKAIMPETRVVVGGAPFRFDAELWSEVGADAMGVTAADAVRIVESWMGGLK